jgi:hypothetical protein
MHFGFRGEQVVTDSEQRQIGADLIEHRRHRGAPERLQPFLLGCRSEAGAIFRRQAFADRLQIVARIEALGNPADRLAQRFAIPQVDRAREHVHLPARIIDIIFADDPVTGIFEQARQGIAHHCSAAMPHMHGPGRIGRDIFDVDGLTATHGGAAIVFALVEDCPELILPDAAAKPYVDEARACHLGSGDVVERGQFRNDQLGKGSRVRAGASGKHHRRVGREVAM